MDQMEMNRFMRAILVRGEQLANIEGAQETARLLQTTASLMAYLCDERDWGPAGDELRAMRDYGDILRICFARRISLSCELPPDRFIRRRVLLDALLEICSLDDVLSDSAGRNLEIQILAPVCAEDAGACEIRVRTAGDGGCELLRRSCRC